MVKDRLGDLLKARDRKDGAAEVQVELAELKDESSSKSNDIRGTFERTEVLKQWIESVEENISAIKQYITRLDNLNFNQKDVNTKIESLFQNNTSISQQITTKLKEFDEDLKLTNGSSAEGRIKTIQYNTLKTRFQQTFNQNTVELENFRNVKKAQLDAQLRAKGVKVTEEELVFLLEEKADIQVFTDNILAETAETKRILQDLEERHQQLLKIERMLVDVRDLFIQMSILVDHQQGLVDRIEYQAQAAQDFVQQGRKEMAQAEKKKIKYLKSKIILIVVAAVLTIIILILLFK
ncbi:syntaxin-1A-like [Cylas formicarius]|uniref:syntaxin-1A-like n=1 Tax=Cylas formicarius TaxID=197179 RepID=UPI002958549F|nr:syntaxin-1A-like [Cylas formicarius]XP_060529316.1 syntaxin-1A-like [Cylas formicarius]